MMKRTGNFLRFYNAKLIFMVFTLLCLGPVSLAAVAKAPPVAPKISGNMAGDPPGVYFYRLEPSFYTGFAPRCQDPKRVQIHLGRGNQIRVTMVLSNGIIDEYLSDLALRYRVYDQLIRESRISLSQNLGFEKFSRIIGEEGIQKLVAQRESMGEARYRKISLEMLKKLNPGKVFNIRIDFDQRMHEWSSRLDP